MHAQSSMAADQCIMCLVWASYDLCSVRPLGLQFVSGCSTKCLIVLVDALDSFLSADQTSVH